MAIRAEDLLKRLNRAQQVGILEDRFNLDGIEVVIRNLTPDEHDLVLQETNDVPEDQYASAMQQAQLCRAIIEVDGVDLRDAASIEVAPKVVDGKTIHVHVERHTWLRENLVSHWGREAIFTAWRKLAELFVRAEKQMVSNIKFDIATETPEEKVRRLLSEAQDAAQELPGALVEAVWGEFGWMPKSTAEELEAVAQRARNWQTELLAETPEEPEDEAPAAPPQPPVQVTPAVPEPRPDPQALMLTRQPLNQAAAQPVRPEQLAPVPLAGRRAAYQADLEGLAALNSSDQAVVGATPETAFRFQEPAEIRKAPVQPEAVPVDQPARGGLNPRFQPRR